MSPDLLPPAEYYASLPKIIAAAGVILHDEHGRFLLVRPSYRDDTWEIPGGGLEEGEYPREAARREIGEELDVDLDLGPLLVLDWVPPQPDGRPALVNFVFDGGRITQQFAEQQVRLQTNELNGWRFFGPDEWGALLLPRMARRLHACAEALAIGRTAYLHHGRHPADLTL